MTWKIELASLGASALIVAGGISITDMSSADGTAEVETFTQSDFDVLNASFQTDNRACEAGLEHKSLCFRSSPLAADITRGAAIPAHVPIMPVRMETLLVTDTKRSGLATYRYGTKLALVDTETNMVVDTLKLGEATFADARADQYAASGGSDSIISTLN